MNLRAFLMGVFSMVFSVFILLYQYANQIILTICKHLNVLSYSQRHIITALTLLSAQGSSAICQYIQIIGNSSISLMSAYSILHFHQHFLHFIVMISHQVHIWFIQLVAHIPDYSHALQESYQCKVGLCYLYLLVGYLGISSQIILTVDLIYLSNLPTIIIYKFLAKVYQILIKYFKILLDLVMIDRESWISCPYHPLLLRDSFKVVYIGLMPIIAFAILVVIFYYLWLTVVIAVLKIIMNVCLNLGIIFDQLGFILCLIKGIDLRPQNRQNQGGKRPFNKKDAFKERIQSLEWITLFQYKTFIQILKGNDLFKQQDNLPSHQTHTNLTKILTNFRIFLK